MASSYPANGPQIDQTFTGLTLSSYNVRIDIMGTDMDSTSEYADIYLDSSYVRRCGDTTSHNGQNWCQQCCNWYNSCYSGSRSITSSTLRVRLYYSSAVNAFGHCTYGGKTGHAVARVILSNNGFG